MRQRYYVDWSDQAYPQVRPVEEGWDAEPLTFGQAKQQIVTHFEALREHAKEQIRIVRQLRTGDVERADSDHE